LPLGNNGWQTGFVNCKVSPVPPREARVPLDGSLFLVTPDYFHAMNIPLLSGRYFDRSR
jgi:hypothetical protein